MSTVHYPDPDHADAEIVLCDGAARRRFADGREEDLPEDEEEAWYQRLNDELEEAAARLC